MSENRLFLSGEENKYSSAIARGPRDRFNSKIPRAQFFFYIISYFGFIFTSAYNSILFCYLRRNVEPCCHAHDSRSCIARENAWSVLHCRLSRVAPGGPIPAKPTTGAIYNQVEAVIGGKARHSLRIEILAYPTCKFVAPVKGVAVEILPCHLVRKN